MAWCETRQGKNNNPCKGKWNLATSPIEYLYSSACFYITGEQGIYEITNYGFLKDINLTNEKFRDVSQRNPN
jgi:hypothetical protein